MRSFIRGVATLLVLSSAAAGCTSQKAAEKGSEALTSTNLLDALLSGEHSGFTVLPQGEHLLDAVDVLTAADPACQPLADLRSDKPKHEPTGTAWAALQLHNGNPAGTVALHSFASGEAKSWMSELRASLPVCKDFSASSQRGWSERSTLVALPSVAVGDESVSYSMTSDQAPGKRPIMTIVRTGGSLAVYLNSSDGNQPPASLMKQQHKKLQTAG
ncbi:hypothetical protein SAVIM338S_07263 [Streptomyces avidinii]